MAGINLKKELESVMQDIRWNFVGILDTQNKLHPIPKNIQVQALFEYLALKELEKLAKKLDCKLTESENTRSYPDALLQGGKIGDKIIAIDVKTGRRDHNNTGFTLGSYFGYFRQPDKKMPGCSIAYGDIDEHWIVGFIYDWNEDADTLHMISNIELIVQEKWRIASKTTGTGTTTAISSVRKIADLRNGLGAFKSEKEFIEYWRNYTPKPKKNAT